MPSDANSRLSNPLLVQLDYLANIWSAHVADLNQSESLFQPPNGGNCINWLLGHIVVSRNEMLEMVGRPAPWTADQRARYARGSEPITEAAADVVEIDKLFEAYQSTQAPIVEAIGSMSEDELAIRVPWFGGDSDKQGALAGFLFHEAYHLGQAGIVRRLLGKSSALGG